MLINPVAGVEVLECCEKDFIKHMDAHMVLEAPQSKKVIPEHIKRNIIEAATKQEASDILFDYLMSNSTKSSLIALCEAVKTAKGASEKMAALGVDMLLKLEQGVCAHVWTGARVYVCAYDVCNVSGHIDEWTKRS